MSKISNLIQSNLSNLLNNVGSTGNAIADAVLNKAKNKMAVNKAAKNILQNSPLEIYETSETGHMRGNFYAYGQVHYPENVMALNSGHYIIIDILETSTIASDLGQYMRKGVVKGLRALGADAAATKAAAKVKKKKYVKGVRTATGYEDRITTPSSGINAGFVGDRHTRVSDTIILYTPPGMKTTYTVNHEGVETGMLGDVLGIQSFSDLAARSGEIMMKIGAEAGAMITSLIPGAGDLKGAISKTTGKAFNNNLEMVFKGVPMREFTYNFEFAPKNRVELDSARKIINLLKLHMHPELGVMNDFIVPSQFQLTFMYLDRRNMYIPKISKCVLKNMDLSHGDESVFNTFAGDNFGAAPIIQKMGLTFAETEVMTKQTIARGF